MAIKYLTPSSSLPQTSAGVTYSSGGNYQININGTASGNSQMFFYYNTSAFPSWLLFDTLYSFKLNRRGSGTVRFQIAGRSGSSWVTIVNSTTDGTFTIPSGTYTGLYMRLYIASGTTVTGSVTPYLNDGLYVPRLSSTGIRYSPYWYSNNPFYNTANPNPPPPNYGLPNCTCYAWGRFWEISDPNRTYTQNRPRLSTGNGQDFYPYTQDGYERGQIPALGAIACYAGGNYSGLGHVCVLEQENGDGTWTVSESAWNGYFFRSSHKILANGDYNDAAAGYTFQGFIYNPFAGGNDSPPYIEGGNFHLILAKRAMQRGKGELII